MMRVVRRLLLKPVYLFDYLLLLRVALRWVVETAKSGNVVGIDFFFLRFRLEIRKGYLGRVMLLPNMEGKPDFLVHIPRKKTPPPASHVPIFSCELLEVCELPDPHVSVRPVRWGLSADEHAQLLALARRSIEWLVRNKAVLSMKEVPRYFPERFLLPADVDVTIWVDGILRGSRIVERMSLWMAVSEAARKACRDPRFKPLALEELPRTRIEIVVFSPLRVPLTRLEYDADRIDYAKGYTFSDGKIGWYVPPVHNTRSFEHLADFVRSLVEQKAKLTWRGHVFRRISRFDVVDFLETSDRTPLQLRGPSPDVGALAHDASWYLRGAEWLCRIQEPDGALPTVTNVTTGRASSRMDWLRLTLAGHALALYGKTHGHGESVQAAERVWTYLVSQDFGENTKLTTRHPFALTYAVAFARALGKDADAGVLTERACEACAEDVKQYGVLEMAHIARVLAQSKGERHRVDGRQMGDVLRARFARAKESETFMPVNWAETVALFWDEDRAFAHTVADRIAACIFPDEKRARSLFAYTRGAGKILEVLALDKKRYHGEIERLEKWLQTMQYTEASSYFIPSDVRPRMLGALRHDWGNTDAWSDSVAHCLVAAARMAPTSLRSR
jgi:AMMECR1 domain-containing protein